MHGTGSHPDTSLLTYCFQLPVEINCSGYLEVARSLDAHRETRCARLRAPGSLARLGHETSRDRNEMDCLHHGQHMCTCDRAKGVLDRDHDLKAFASSQKEGAAARTSPASFPTCSPQCDLAALHRKQQQKIVMVDDVLQFRSLGSLRHTVAFPQSLSQTAPVIITLAIPHTDIKTETRSTL